MSGLDILPALTGENSSSESTISPEMSPSVQGWATIECEHIVEANEWPIEVTAGPDGGARFEVLNVER